ncbi:MFS transporter [Cohnella sp. 56]|uniref:MFS transporter n=1 Tax=Cohnella sp. 56 TaxID=3113722 RepID=UPI0030EA2A4C
MNRTWFKESRHAWIGLGSLWVIGFIGALTRFIMAFFQTQISDDLGIGRSFISAAWSTNLLIAALCAPAGGWLADRYGPKKVMLISAILGVAGTGTVVLGGHEPIVFFVGYGVISGFVGLGSSTSYMFMFEWFKHHRAKATALLASASSVGLAVVTPVFVSWSWLTWRDAFAASFALGAAVTLPVIWLGIRHAQPARQPQPAQPGPPPEPAAADGGAPRAPVMPRSAVYAPLFVLIAFALFTCGFNMGTVEMNLVAIHQLAKVPPHTIALAMSLLGMMEIAGSLAFGYFLDRVDKLMLMTLLYGIRVLGFGVLFMHDGWSPLVFAAAFGITYLSAVPGGLLIARERAQGQGKQTGFLLMFHQGGGILGALVAGILFDRYGDYQLLIGADVFICVIAALGYAYLYATGRTRSIGRPREQTAAG